MIRPATEDDVAQLVALERIVFGADAWSVDLVRARVGQTVVAEAAQLLSCDSAERSDDVVTEQLCGSATLTLAGEIADLERIAVHPAHRRTGLGRALLAVALDRAAGADRVLLEVRADNAAAQAFYADAGFTEIDRRRRYYRDGTDAVVLALDLG